MGHWGEKRPPPFSHPWQERGTHTTGDSLALAFVGRDHKPAHLATGCIFPWTDDVDVCSQGLRRLAATRRRTLSTSLLLLCPSRRRGTQRFCRHCRPASSFLSSFLSPPPFLLFFPSRGDPVTVGRSPWAVVFSLRNKVSRGFPLTEKGCGRGKVLFVAVYPAHPTPEALFLISPAKRSANAAQACPTTLAVVSALRNTLCKSGQETLWSEAFLFFFLPKFLRGHRQCFVERRGTTTGVFLHQALYTVRPLLALSLLVYEGLRHFFSLLFFSLSLLGIKP